jgi:hypothetical protein
LAGARHPVGAGTIEVHLAGLFPDRRLDDLDPRLEAVQAHVLAEGCRRVVIGFERHHARAARDRC